MSVQSDVSAVTQSDIDRVKREAEHAAYAISSFLGIEESKPIHITIVGDGIVRLSGETILLPSLHVHKKQADIVGMISRLLTKHSENKFFSIGLSVFFQNRFGEDHAFTIPTSEKLHQSARGYKNQLMPIVELVRDSGIFRQVDTNKRKVAFVQAGSFFEYLDWAYGGEKLKELHDSPNIDYVGVYGKNLIELD